MRKGQKFPFVTGVRWFHAEGEKTQALVFLGRHDCPRYDEPHFLALHYELLEPHCFDDEDVQMIVRRDAPDYVPASIPRERF